MSIKLEGKIKWYNSNKVYVFIERKDGEKGTGLKYYLQGSHVTTSDHLRQTAIALTIPHGFPHRVLACLH